MSKNKKKDFFGIKCSTFFTEDKRKKISRTKEDDIYEMLSEDISVILEKITENRDGNEKGYKGKFPKFVVNIFYNLSSYKFLLDYIDSTDLEDDEKASMLTILEIGYREHFISKNMDQKESQDRIDFIIKSIKILYPKKIKKVSKAFKISKNDAATLFISLVGEEVVHQAKTITRIMDASDIKFKKKLKNIKKFFGDKYYPIIGSMLTLSGKGNFSIECFHHMEKSKKRKRKKYLIGYAESYKIIPTSSPYFQSTEFMTKNKKLIKKIIQKDIGFKKAFTAYNPKDKRGGVKITEKNNPEVYKL